MKALVKKKNEPGLWMEDVPVPEMKDDEVLIKTHRTAICGTDVHIYKWDAWAQKTIPVPMVVGHEFMGEIVKMGKNVTGLHVGQMVSGEGHITCGTCRNCRIGQRHLCPNTKGVGVNRHGVFAEFFNLPAVNVFPLPDGIDPDVASIFDPYGNAVHTALSGDMLGEDVLITGAGPIGMMAAAIAHHAGARNVIITDINDYRLEQAKKMGATRAVNVGRESLKDVMKQQKIVEGFDFAMEMSGAPAGLNTCLQTVLPGATVALLGILPPNTVIDWDLVIFKGLYLKGIYGREIFGTWYKGLHMLQSGLDISNVITHRFSIDDYEKGFEVMLNGTAAKVILSWK